MTYYTVNDFEREEVIRRSRFLTVLKKVDDEDEATAFLTALKAKYHDASHVWYAYRVGERAERARFSDAGEPQGTAGKPILDALVSAEATYSLIAVVRWFGGVKLGAGGLTRAYRLCAASGIEEGGRRKFTLCSLFEICTDLSLYGAVVKTVESRGGVVTARDFSDKVNLTVAVEEAPEAIFKAVNDTTKGNVGITPLESRFLEI